MDAPQIRGLDETISGRVLGPTTPGYDDARRTFNALIDRRPAAMAQVRGPEDVVATIRFARDHAIALGVRGGGHSVAGHAIVEDGLVVDLRELRAVSVDPVRRVAHVGGGAQWMDLDAPALAHGLGVPGGAFGDTGVGGLTLGGGIGFLMGLGGYTCDNLVGAQVVTAAGEVLEAADDPELLWALRGGGGNFGVATRFDLALIEVGPAYGGKATVPLGDGAILRRYAAMMRDAPDALLPMLVLLPGDDGTPLVEVQFSYVGDADDGAAFAGRLVDGDPTAHAGLHAGTYLDIQAMNPIEAFGGRNYWTSTFVRDLEADLIDLLVEVAATFPSPESGVLIEPVHGQARRTPMDHAAIAHRRARTHVSAIGTWHDPSLDAVCTAWSKDVTARVSAWSTGGLYTNYAMPGEAASSPQVERARAAYPPDAYERLRRVKGRYDPDNVFRGNLNIPPA